MSNLEPTVLVLDDDASVRTALRRLLLAAGKQVQVFGSLAELLDSERLGGPGCLVLDVRLPGLTGLDVYQVLSDAGVPLPAVFISGVEDIPTTVQAMKSGAVDFLAKPLDEQELLHAVDRAIDSDATWRAERAERQELNDRFASLTLRERQVFALVVTGMLNKQVAARLGTSEKTVKVHRARVKEKMHADSLPDLVQMAQRLDMSVGTAGLARADQQMVAASFA